MNKIFGPYLVTDSGLCLHHSLEDVVRLSALGGVKLVQLREKDKNTREFLELAKKLIEVLRPFHVPLIINDRLDITLISGADGIHLGQSDLPHTEARRFLGQNKIIGLSIEKKDDLINLENADALDYLGVSPVFSTPTKTDTKTPWGLDGLRWARRNTKLPLVAIGGINESNAKEVIQAGADSIAVVSYLCSAKDPKFNAETLNSCFSKR
ncbi:thiamine phosphate synthase [Leptospira sp. 96542]|nr:thiamine phosphate synthase [Leptospira sp. 96542]